MYKDFVITSSNRSKIGFTGAENESLVIPEKFQDTDGTWYKVVGISEGAFFKCENLTNVTLPDTIKYIDSSVFAYCSSLESCVIPNGITNLYSTFRDCTSLKSVTLPDSITSIGPYTFFNCNQLTEITLPKNLRSLDDSALRWCSSLTTLVLPEKVSALGYAAFELNTGLRSITIPKSLSFIDECVFSSCKNLRKIDYQGTQEDWHNITFVNGWHLNTPVVFIQCTDGIVYSAYQQQSGSGSVSVRS
ncbi:MAG: leucine-rich repeat domain-containing protein [Clostridia bacterium]|nr:leucine-rich repeat domain-containing protein [Clostridia bacterium]